MINEIKRINWPRFRTEGPTEACPSCIPVAIDQLRGQSLKRPAFCCLFGEMK